MCPALPLAFCSLSGRLFLSCSVAKNCFRTTISPIVVRNGFGSWNGLFPLVSAFGAFLGFVVFAQKCVQKATLSHSGPPRVHPAQVICSVFGVSGILGFIAVA